MTSVVSVGFGASIASRVSALSGLLSGSALSSSVVSVASGAVSSSASISTATLSGIVVSVGSEVSPHPTNERAMAKLKVRMRVR